MSDYADASTERGMTPKAGRPRRAALAGWIGSALEYYDFFIYGTAAALVFQRIFFPEADPVTGTLLSLATFGVGYVARPLGALFLGHLGDRLGRKRVLVLTLLLMGMSTFLVGCLPTYNDIGVAAPIALVVLRLLQGVSAAGEQAGANSMTLEHSPENKRAYYTSFTLSGTQGGQILATAVFLPIAALPEEQLFAWGWRIPFWISAVVVLIGFVIRQTLDETPEFKKEVSGSEVAQLPTAVLFRDHWAAVLRIVVAAVIASVSTIFTVFALDYAVSLGVDRAFMLWVGVLANITALFAIPLCAKLADRIGRKPVFIAGSLGSGVLMFAYLWSISVDNRVLILVFGIVMFGVVYSAANGVWPAFYGEMFTTRVRLSGMAIGTQIGFAIAGFMPSLAVWLAGSGERSWFGVSMFVGALCVVNAIAVASGKETHRVPTAELGRKAERDDTREPAMSGNV